MVHPSPRPWGVGVVVQVTGSLTTRDFPDCVTDESRPGRRLCAPPAFHCVQGPALYGCAVLHSLQELEPSSLDIDTIRKLYVLVGSNAFTPSLGAEVSKPVALV